MPPAVMPMSPFVTDPPPPALGGLVGVGFTPPKIVMLVTPFSLFEPVPQVTFTDQLPFCAFETIVATPARPGPLGLRVSETEPLLVNTAEVAVPDSGWIQVGTV